MENNKFERYAQAERQDAESPEKGDIYTFALFIKEVDKLKGQIKLLEIHLEKHQKSISEDARLSIEEIIGQIQESIKTLEGVLKHQWKDVQEKHLTPENLQKILADLKNGRRKN